MQLLQGRATSAPWPGPLPDLAVVRQLPANGQAVRMPTALLRSEISDLGLITWASLRLQAQTKLIATSYLDIADNVGMGGLSATAVQQRLGQTINELIASGWLRRYRVDRSRHAYSARVLPRSGTASGLVRLSDLALLGKRLTVSHLVDFCRWQTECGDRGWTAEGRRVIARRWLMSVRTFERRTAELITVGLIETVRRPGHTDLVWLRELVDHTPVPWQRLSSTSRGREAIADVPAARRTSRPRPIPSVTSDLAGSSEGGRRRQVPARFERLHDYLSYEPTSAIVLSFDQLDELVESGMPLRSRCSREWWSNNPQRPHARTWLSAGRLAEADPRREQVVFRRGARPVPALANLRKQRAARRQHAQNCLTSADENRRHQRPAYWTPHTVYLLHLPAEGLFKVGITQVGTDRVKLLSSGRDTVVVDQVTVPNRFVAEIAEADVLDSVEPWHKLGSLTHPAGGYTEMWSDGGPSVDLPGFVRAAAGGPRGRPVNSDPDLVTP